MKKSLLVGVLFAAAVVVAPATVDAASGVRATIRNTGPKSYNKVRVNADGGGRWRVRVNNNTNANANVDTNQDARSGNAVVRHNTYGGDAESGSAGNENELVGTVDVYNDNAGAAGCNDCNHSDVDVTIEMTGPRSDNIVRIGDRMGRSRRGGNAVNNNTNVNVNNTTDQEAESGDAMVKGNTEGGDATSGDAGNYNGTDVAVKVENNNEGAAGCGCDGGDVDVEIENTGPNSDNVVTIGGGRSGGGVRVNNNSNMNVTNNTDQTATTGDAVVRGNTKGGDATSGDAGNSNVTHLGFYVTNNN